MKHIFLLFILFTVATHSQAQFFKKIKDKVNKTIDKSVNPAGPVNEQEGEIEKKEAIARTEYSDDLENGELPVFATHVPENGKQLFVMKQHDKFWGGCVQLVRQPAKEVKDPDLFDYIATGVVAAYGHGEMNAFASYKDGVRTDVGGYDSTIDIPFKPLREFYTTINKTPLFTGTEIKTNTTPGIVLTDKDMAVIQKNAANQKDMAEKMQNMTKEEMIAYALANAGKTAPATGTKETAGRLQDQMKNTPPATFTDATFSFQYNGKAYGPIKGKGNAFITTKNADNYFAYGTATAIGEKEVVYTYKLISGIGNIEYETTGGSKSAAINADASYPQGLAAMMTITKGIGKDNDYELLFKTTSGRTFGPFPKSITQICHATYLSDNGHLVALGKAASEKGILDLSFMKDYREKYGSGENVGNKAIIDYKTVVSYPVNHLKKENLLIATDPSRSVYYEKHVLYYADGTNEAIDNIGTPQLVSFNGKDFIVWFEVIKNDKGHQVLIAKKELK